MVVKVGTMLERDFLLSSNPKVFFITDHYREYPAVLVRLDKVSKQIMRELLMNSWRRVAPKKLVAQFEAAASYVATP